MPTPLERCSLPTAGARTATAPRVARRGLSVFAARASSLMRLAVERRRINPPHPLILFFALFTRTLHHLSAFSGRGIAPLLAQRLALPGGQLLKTVKVLAHRVLLGRRQSLEALPAGAQCAALFLRQRLPA